MDTPQFYPIRMQPLHAIGDPTGNSGLEAYSNQQNVLTRPERFRE